VRTLSRRIFAAFPNIHFAVTGMIAEGAQVFAALHTTGQGAGDFMGRDMRGKPVDVFEAMFARIEGEK
jgi:predicted ester cyclase